MSRAVKILLAIAALPLGLILLGVIGGLAGIEGPDSEPKVEKPVQTTQSVTPNPVPVAEPSTPDTPMPVPRDLTEDGVADWLVGGGFFYIQGDHILSDADKFSALTGEDAVRLYRLIHTASQTTGPDGEDREEGYNALRLNFFAGAAALPPPERRIFIDEVGGVFRPNIWSGGPHRGDYLRLFDWHKRDQTGMAEWAIRDYAKILTDKEMIHVLDQIGAITKPGTRGSNPHARYWWVHPGEALAPFEPDTLQAIHDAINKTVGGDRPKLRGKIRKIIESRHAADN